MAIVVPDHLSANSAEISVESISLTRSFFVYDLRSAHPAARLKEAAEADGVPKLGDEHPYFTGVKVTSIAPDMVDTKIAMVTVTYGIPQRDEPSGGGDGPAVVNVSSTVITVRTNIDAEGKIIKVGPAIVSRPSKATPGQNANIRLDAVAVEIDLSMPTLVLNVQRLETKAPYERAAKFLGTINSNKFLAFPARTWLCTRVDSSTSSGGKFYTVTYEFTKKPSHLFVQKQDTWDTTLIYIEKETGQPLLDSVNGGHIRTSVRVYLESNFDELKLGI